MISLEKAQRLILERVSPLGSEMVSLYEARSRFTFEAALARVDLPVFDNSAMDGYALRVADQAVFGSEGQTGLEVIGEIPAGKELDTQILPGTCVRIFTGSILPAGADAVIMQEDVDTQEVEGGLRVWIRDTVKPWENVRFQGEEIRKGQEICEKGVQLTPARLALLSHAGVDRIRVSRKLKVGILATGEELVEPGQELARGQIYESNRLAYASLLEQCGAEPEIFPIVPDNLDSTCQTLESALSQCDWILTSGGVSVGDHDYVKEAVEKLGGKTAFWKIRMKPGKPFAMGEFLGGQLWFGAPGNPVSGMVGFHLLVAPAVRKSLGVKNPLPRWISGSLAANIQNPGNRRHFVRGVMNEKGMIQPLKGQASHRLSSISEAQALIDVPAESSLTTGDSIRFCFLPETL